MKSSKAFLPLNSADHLAPQGLIPRSQLRQILEVSKRFLYQEIWEKRILYPLTRAGEPQVWQKCDRHGNVFYHVYDPISQTSACLESEQAVRIWLESRYQR